MSDFLNILDSFDETEKEPIENLEEKGNDYFVIPDDLDYRVMVSEQENEFNKGTHKKYITLNEAFDDVLYFVQEVKIFQTAQLRAYIFEMYYRARNSKNIKAKEKRLDQWILNEDVNRCIKMLVSKGYINFTEDERFAFDTASDLKELKNQGRMNPMFGLSLWFFVSKGRRIKDHQYITKDVHNGERIQFMNDNTIYSIIPLPTPDFSKCSFEEAIEKSKKLLALDTGNGIPIFLLPSKQLFSLYLKMSLKQGQPWFSKGIVAVMTKPNISSMEREKMFTVVELQSVIEEIKSKSEK